MEVIYYVKTVKTNEAYGRALLRRSNLPPREPCQERRAIRGLRSTKYAVRSVPRWKVCRLLHAEKHHQSWFSKFEFEIIDILIHKASNWLVNFKGFLTNLHVYGYNHDGRMS